MGRGAGGHRQPGARPARCRAARWCARRRRRRPAWRRPGRRTGRSRRWRRAGRPGAGRPARRGRRRSRPSSASAGPGAQAPVGGAPDEPVPLEGDGQPVGRRPGQAGAADELGEGRRLVGDGAENGHRFVQDGDGVRLSHTAILASHSETASEMASRGDEPCRRPWRRRSTTPTSCAAPTGEPDLLYIDLHLVHEVTSPQAFDGLRAAGRTVRRPDLTMATEDHNVPTLDILAPIADPVSRAQVEALRSERRRVRHPAGPDGRPRPGHRARHRPAARAHPAGHDDRLRRQPHLHPRRLRRAGVRHRHQRGRARARHPDAAAVPRPSRWRSPSTASCRPGVTAKDVILAVIAQIGTGGGQGHVIEYRGSAIETLSMEARMTICNMSIEAGAKAGPDRPRPDHLRLPAGPPARPAGRRLGRRRRVLDDAAHRRGRRLRPRGAHRRRRR